MCKTWKLKLEDCTVARLYTHNIVCIYRNFLSSFLSLWKDIQLKACSPPFLLFISFFFSSKTCPPSYIHFSLKLIPLWLVMAPCFNHLPGRSQVKTNNHYHHHTSIQYITKVITPLTFLQIFKYISSWDNTDKITLWYNEK